MQLNRRTFGQLTVGAFAIPSLLALQGCTITDADTLLLDAAEAAVEAAVGILAGEGIVPAATAAYINDAISALSNATGILSAGGAVATIGAKLNSLFANVILPDLAGLSPRAVAIIKSVSSAIAAFLAPFQPAGTMMANAASADPTVLKPGLRLRWHLSGVRGKLNKLHVAAKP